jgi:hypothetical protein
LKCLPLSRMITAFFSLSAMVPILVVKSATLAENGAPSSGTVTRGGRSDQASDQGFSSGATRPSGRRTCTGQLLGGLKRALSQKDRLRARVPPLHSLAMAAEIAKHPKDDRGREILDELEKRTKLQPEVLSDGTRRYYVSATDADVDALDPMLERIDPNWRDHITSAT